MLGYERNPVAPTLLQRPDGSVGMQLKPCSVIPVGEKAILYGLQAAEAVPIDKTWKLSFTNPPQPDDHICIVIQSIRS